MRCWQCGHEIGDGATFCTSCGVRVTPEDVATTRVRVVPQSATGQPPDRAKGGRGRWVAATAAAVTVSLVVIAGVAWWLAHRGGSEDEALVLEG